MALSSKETLLKLWHEQPRIFTHIISITPNAHAKGHKAVVHLCGTVTSLHTLALCIKLHVRTFPVLGAPGAGQRYCARALSDILRHAAALAS
eukprot:1149467-Pelagomonas_calceolata.AAC.12